MHHGNQFPDELFQQAGEVEKQISNLKNQLGATGRYPEGKLTESDEGEIRLAVGTAKGKVVMNFGKPTAWIGFNANQAIDIANLLKKHARKLDKSV